MISMGKRFALLLLAFGAGAAHADYDPSQYPAYETCALCHGLFGVSHTAKFPNLAGQKHQYITNQIRAFLDGHRTNDGGQMSAIVTELEPEDIPFVADWFSTQDPPDPYASDETASGLAHFEALRCGVCHSNSQDDDLDVPYLTAQHPGYLEKQMTDFREGDRKMMTGPAVHASALAISDTEIEAIARYLGSVARK